jgi:muramoyltetrapeptide carboxypeptidase
LVYRGLSFLKTRYRVAHGVAAFRRDGYLAGTDALRLSELQAALDDPGVAAIVAARGGYGLTRIIDQLDLSGLLRHPKWLVGFSDFTALHVEAVRAGIATMHAHNVAGLGRGDAVARAEWLSALEHPSQPRVVRDLEVWQAGDADGPLFGGNLTLLCTCAAAGRLKPPAGAIWFLEDVTETSYRIDRMLTALTAAGAFRDAAAVLVGDFTDCGAGLYRVPTRSVLQERLSRLGVPVRAGLRVGHGRFNLPLCLGGRARVDDASVTLCGP